MRVDFLWHPRTWWIGLTAVTLFMVMLLRAFAGDLEFSPPRGKQLTVYSFEKAGLELARVNQADKVVTITTAGIEAGWTCQTPTPTPPPTVWRLNQPYIIPSN